MEQVSAEPKIKFDVCCVKCGYKWKTGTPLLYISCPNCRHTNKTQEARDKFAELPVDKVASGRPSLHLDLKKVNLSVTTSEPEEDNSELKRANRIASGEE